GERLCSLHNSARAFGKLLEVHFGTPFIYIFKDPAIGIFIVMTRPHGASSYTLYAPKLQIDLINIKKSKGSVFWKTPPFFIFYRIKSRILSGFGRFLPVVGA